MNDSLRTDIFVRYSPETIACSCIYLSARLLQVGLPLGRPRAFRLGSCGTARMTGGVLPFADTAAQQPGLVFHLWGV